MRLRGVHGLDLDRALHDATGPVLLVVTRPACGACRATRAALAQVEVPGLEAWEVDATSAPALVEELGIFHLPALWLCLDGEPAAPVHAEATPGRLLHALSTALAATRAP